MECQAVKILLIDWNNFIKKYSATGNLYEVSKNELTGVIMPRIMNNISKILTNLSPDMVFVCTDNGVNRRAKAIYSDYKANRGKAKSLTDEERETDNLNILSEFIQTYPFGFLSIQNTEADMLIKCTIDFFKNLDENIDFVIASMDSDFYQLLDEHTSIYDWNHIIHINNWNTKIKSKFDIMPYNYALCKAIVGDKSDNISGIKGWGWTRTTRIFSLLEKTYKNCRFHNINTLVRYVADLARKDNDAEVTTLLNKFLVDIDKETNKEILARNIQLIDLSMLETPYIFNINNEIKKILTKTFVFDKKHFTTYLNLKGYKTSTEILDTDYQMISRKNLIACFELSTFAKKTQKIQTYFQKRMAN